MDHTPSKSTQAALALSALGIVYGDIGTSPLYAFRECFHPALGITPNSTTILGILSLIIWALILVVTVKYLLVVMRADNEGEGGILALLALSLQQREPSSLPAIRGPVVALGLLGAALVYGDGIITPAISVLSAMEGIEVETSRYQPYTVPMAIVILCLLFVIQPRGTGRIGTWFGPVMLLWFGTLAGLGISSIVQSPEVLAAVSPHHGLGFLSQHPALGFVVLGSVFLALTGAEALYADMGHFGKGPIRLGWYAVVLPALVLQYLGQGALLLRQPDAVSNPFYLLAPSWFLLPLVILATAATVIASQAMLTGAFSLTQQAMQLGYLPRMDIRFTSADHMGQIYVPVINWLMLIGTLGLVLVFTTSSNLAAAYGIAVAGTMVITTLLLFVVMRQRWNWSRPVAGAVTGVFLIIDLVFLSANVLKIPQGGWWPLLLGSSLFVLMTTWSGGRRLVAQQSEQQFPPLTTYLTKLLASHPARVPGCAVYLTQSPHLAPSALIQNVRHNKVLHQHILFLTISTARVPVVASAHQTRAEQLQPGIYRMTFRHGFMQPPDVPAFLKTVQGTDFTIPLKQLTYFLSRTNPLATARPGMALWRERLFGWLAKNSQRASSYFQLPSDQVVEIGAVVEI